MKNEEDHSGEGILGFCFCILVIVMVFIAGYNIGEKRNSPPIVRIVSGTSIVTGRDLVITFSKEEGKQ